MPAALVTGQQASVVDSGTALSVSLPSPATAGNLIVFAIGGDKNIGTLTMGGTGWSVPINLRSTSVSLVLAFKTAAGGETAITATIDTTGGCTLWVGEYAEAGAGAWTNFAQALNNSDESAVTTWASGTTGAATGAGRAIAVFSVDSSGAPGTPSYSNSYTSRRAQPVGGGEGGLWVAERDIAASATTSTTLTLSGAGADQMSGGVVVLGRVASSPDQAVTPAGIASGEAFGAAALAPAPVGAVLTGIASTEAHGSPRIATVLGPPGITSAEEFGTAAVVPAGAAAPAGITSAEAFGAPTLTTTSVAVAVAGIASGEAFGAPLLALTVTATGIASGEAIGAPTVATGAVTAAPTGIASGEVFGLAVLTAGAVAAVAAGIGSAEDVPAPRVSLTIYPAGVASAAAFGSSALTVGAITITVVGIASGEAFGSPQVGVTLDPGLRTGRPQRRFHVTYELVCVRRIPQSSGPPAFLEVDPIEWSTLTWSSTLSRPQTLTAVCPVTSITESVRQLLRAPDRLPMELWLLRDGQRVCAGPLMGGRRSGTEMTLEASGLLAYLGYWIVAADKRFDQVDQFAIAAWLIDQWQALEYGHYGIDTSGVGASGKLRDRSYVRDEIHPVARRLEELGAVADGFDAEVDPVTRKLQLWHPGKGVDRSSGADAVVFDDRVITSPETMFSVAPGDLASDAFGAASSSGAESPLWSTQGNAELRASFGRAAVTGSWSGVSEQATLDDHTSALLDARDQALFVPGPSMRVTPDADLSAYDVGDTVAVEMDSTLGLAGAFRVRKRTVRVAKTGAESVDLEFV